ncbi:MAG: type 4a pilus biogenesis protein PilO [Desulfobacteraceae bacterium]|nr:type 4a pilus biogenesis protein PilO [Desulfobacteraceae bacterium]
MKKAKNTTAKSSIGPLFEKIEQLTKLQRISIWVGLIVIIVGAFVYFSYLPKYKKIDQLKKSLVRVEQQLEKAKRNARQLNKYRNDMKDAEEQFKLVTRQLPEKEEIPSLLASISQSGKDSGLNFMLFQPKPEINKEFYAEIPVAMKVTGSYHSVATFFEKVSKLSRIVNITNIRIKPDKKNSTLTTSCTAVTYKFIEANKKANKKSKRRGKKS